MGSQVARRRRPLRPTVPPAAEPPDVDAAGCSALLTPAEVAAILRVKLKTLSNWRANRSGPEFVKLGDPRGSAPVRYPKTALVRWLSKISSGSDDSLLP
jgi:hypothetical protein